jgi:uncharacterized RmlC-like cupin family protein
MPENILFERPNQLPDELTIIRPDADILTSQVLTHFVGISAQTAGARHLAMYLAIIPPGGIAPPHTHPNHETAIYLLQGRVELRYGEGLQQCQICEAGDFIFTPAGVPHQPRNLSSTEPVYILAARNDSATQEHSVPYNHL